MRDAGHTLHVAVEIEGWPLTVHFVALGVGPTVVTGCLQPPPGPTAIPITDLPKIIFHAVHRPRALDDPRTAAPTQGRLLERWQIGCLRPIGHLGQPR